MILSSIYLVCCAWQLTWWCKSTMDCREAYQAQVVIPYREVVLVEVVHYMAMN